MIARLELSVPYTLVNDAFGVLRAGSADGCGVVVIAGTGPTVAGRNRSGATFRTFGLGVRWGDFNGAAGLVLETTCAIRYAWIGRGPATTLSDAFVQAYGAANAPDPVDAQTRRRARSV